MRITRALQHSWNAQQGHLFPWSAVCFGLGVALYFKWPVEPGVVVWAVVLCSAISGAVLCRVSRLWGCAVLLIAAGFLCANLRAHLVAAPVIEFRYYGPVEGRLVAIDRSQSDALRLTLDQVHLSRMAQERTPRRVRITARDLATAPPIGARVMTTAHLSLTGGPVEPGGFDFRRHLWFLGIGAVGYTRVPVLLSDMPGSELWVARHRAQITQALHNRLLGAGGAVAAAVLTGDRSGLDAETVHVLRVSNLAHLLAISGLHMGLLTGVVFTALRMTLVVGGLALGRDLRAKKLAAAGALLAGAAYLAVSGGNVATERAFVMVAVVLGAVLLGRRALTLRAVALAALVVLVHRPESLLGPGFQMSFAATTALVAVFGYLRGQHWNTGPSLLRPVLMLLLSSGIAGLATAPFGAAHFNTMSHYGLLANTLAVPVMGGLVMPAAVLAVVLLPFGVEGLALWAMVQGLEWILWVAHFVADLPNPQSFVAQPQAWVLALISIGGLCLCLLQGWVRSVGLICFICAVVAWRANDRPYLLVSEDGGLIGLRTEAGRALSRDKGSGFIAKVWLENDGTPASQAAAAARWSDAAARRFGALRGKRAAEGFAGCGAHVIVVSNQPLPDKGRDMDCLVIDPDMLRLTGSLSVAQSGEITTNRAVSGLRLWSPSKWHTAPDPLAGKRVPRATAPDIAEQDG
ncbi:ComEC family competence protein [Epibacterium ulvae]|uniref:ComEC/Rec2 family competence protein n=1 Tax=Epibacterium ulvae TaxID=1156985 RepID=UPI001BFCCA84|nr:ComEC/Rec2 family competence protein [Epibacterium ulvae]MBT8152455.1 ComEC family competence protein [Epibacterium ulvae]